jgi:hypothetical protein
MPVRKYSIIVWSKSKSDNVFELWIRLDGVVASCSSSIDASEPEFQYVKCVTKILHYLALFTRKGNLND